jgi:3-phenylpropionate/trans-cinnamate dioxygenase ferredoxin subunit
MSRAAANVCPHLGAPLCPGELHGTHRPSDVFEFTPDFTGGILRCPWHGREFGVIPGKGLYDRNSRVGTYLCEVDGNGDVVVLI